MTREGSNFIREIAEAYRALEAEGNYLSDIEKLKNEKVLDGERIARLEIKLMDRSDEVDGLKARIRSLEVERDDASFRELEAQDKLDAMRRLVKAFVSDVGSLEKAEEPQPVKVEPFPFVNEERVTTQSEVIPPSTGSAELKAEDGPTELSQPEQVLSAAPSSAYAEDGCISPGERAEDPTATGPSDTETIPPPSASSSTATERDGAATAPGPYAGKRYADVPGIISLADWLAGGGTEKDWYMTLPVASTASHYS